MTPFREKYSDFRKKRMKKTAIFEFFANIIPEISPFLPHSEIFS